MEGILAREIGKSGNARYVLRECLVCGNKKWIFLKHHYNTRPRNLITGRFI